MSGWLFAAWIGCQAWDGGTTAVMLHHGGREMNPVMQQGRSLTVKLAGNVALGWFQHHNATARRRKIIPLVMATTGCAAGAWNTAQLRK